MLQTLIDLWPMILLSTGAVGGATVFWLNILRIRELRLKIKNMSEAKKVYDGPIILPNDDEIVRYSSKELQIRNGNRLIILALIAFSLSYTFKQSDKSDSQHVFERTATRENELKAQEELPTITGFDTTRLDLFQGRHMWVAVVRVQSQGRRPYVWVEPAPGSDSLQVFPTRAAEGSGGNWTADFELKEIWEHPEESIPGRVACYRFGIGVARSDATIPDPLPYEGMKLDRDLLIENAGRYMCTPG